MHQQQVELDLDLERDEAGSDGAASMEGGDDGPRDVHGAAVLARAADADAMDQPREDRDAERDADRDTGRDTGQQPADATAGDSDRADEEVEELTGHAERKAAEGSPRL